MRVCGDDLEQLVELRRVYVRGKLETDHERRIIPKVACEYVEDGFETGHVIRWWGGTLDVWAARVELDADPRYRAFAISKLSSKVLDGIEHGRERDW